MSKSRTALFQRVENDELVDHQINSYVLIEKGCELTNKYFIQFGSFSVAANKGIRVAATLLTSLMFEGANLRG